MTTDRTVGLDVDGVSKVFARAGAEVHAVDDLTFHVAPGTALSVVGPNGAGKSTLLRLVAGITAPTRGTVRRPARCTSLIELGAGFHPDLTVDENIDLGLALAGHDRRSQRRTRSDVLAFAGIGHAHDRRVKHLSNGMVARLACGIALQTAPDLLLLDEVLAVGDHAFQRQMLDAVGALVEEGTSVVLVTHSIELAAAASTRTIHIAAGRLEDEGPTEEVLARYEHAIMGLSGGSPVRGVRIESVELSATSVTPGGTIDVRATIACTAAVGPTAVRVEVRPVIGDTYPWMRSHEEPLEIRHANLVASTAGARIPELSTGVHRVDIHLPHFAISSSLVELATVLVDGDGHVIDRVASDLRVGEAARRPHYHLEAAVVGPQD